MTTENLVSVFLPTVFCIGSEAGDSTACLDECKALSRTLVYMINHVDQVMRLPARLAVPRTPSLWRPLKSPFPEVRLSSREGAVREFRADAVLETNPIELFKRITDDRLWDPTFLQYDYVQPLDESTDLFAARTVFCDPSAAPLLLAR